MDLKIPEAPHEIVGGPDEAIDIINSCIKCGCCNAICPTFDLLGDELDSPRGRIALIKDMIEDGHAPDAETVAHLDKCLSCNACLTACPSDVDYMHLIDIGRAHVEENYKRPLANRLLRDTLAKTLSDAEQFEKSMNLGRKVKWAAPILKAIPALKPAAAMLEALPAETSQAPLPKGLYPAKSDIQKRVLIPSGCVQNKLDAEIDNATVNLLTHLGVDVTLPDNDGCCGALNLHLGKSETALDQVRRNVDAWYPLIEEGLDAIVITTTGCGTTFKDYGHLLQEDPAYRDRAAAVAALAMDVTEFLVTLKLPKPLVKPKLTVAYHAACSLQHAQQVTNPPRKLLLKAGFKQVRPENEQQCCGSAGTYSILQSEISQQLRYRKVAALEATRASVITAGNIGCLQHIGSGTTTPIVHIVKLLNWAFAGEKPSELAHIPEQS